jgi:hypothetical protein
MHGKENINAKLRGWRYKQMIIVASNGYEVIDNRPEAENADSLAKHFENRYAREQKRRLSDQLHKNKHPFAKVLANTMGLL